MGLVDIVIKFFEPTKSYVFQHSLLMSFIIILFYFFLASLIHYVLKHWVRFLFKKINSKLLDRVIIKINNPLSFLILLAGIFIALEKIIIKENFVINLVETFIIIIVTYIMTIIADTLLDFWSHNYNNKKSEEFHDEVLPLTKGTSRLIFSIIGFLFLLDSWDIKILPLLASFGVLGAILGLAFQDSMKNIFGGIALIMDKDFHIGDVIQLNTGDIGEVTEITLRSTKIKNFDNKVAIIPNALLATTKFINFAKPTQTIRLIIPVSLAYGSDPNKVEEVLLGALKNNTKILKYPKREIRMEKLSEYSVDYKVLFFISDYHEKFVIQNQVIKDIYDALYTAKLEIPFPTRTMLQGKSLIYKPKKKSN